jgi:hypothetical protein
MVVKASAFSVLWSMQVGVGFCSFEDNREKKTFRPVSSSSSSLPPRLNIYIGQNITVGALPRKFSMLKSYIIMMYWYPLA